MTKPPPADHETLSREQLASAASDMCRVLDQHPLLGDFGFGVFDARRKTPQQREAELIEQRHHIQRPRALAGFLAAREWLSRFNKIRASNKRGSSYGLKHVAEHDIGYITNGVFIAAAIAEGFRVERCDYGSPNAWFNISALAWKRPFQPSRHYDAGRRPGRLADIGL